MIVSYGPESFVVSNFSKSVMNICTMKASSLPAKATLQKQLPFTTALHDLRGRGHVGDAMEHKSL